MRWKNVDLSLICALLAAFFALVMFTADDGSWAMGVFFVVFAISFVFDFIDKLKLLGEIADLEEKLRNEKNERG